MNNNVVSESRRVLLNDWLKKTLGNDFGQIQALCADASHRRYYRIIQSPEQSYVVMDAPPDRENCRPYVAIAKTFLKLGLKVPEIFAADFTQGFLLMSDFGDRVLSKEINLQNVETFYQNAFNELLVIQSCQSIEGYSLPQFDILAYRRKLTEFHEWYLQRWLNLQITSAEQEMLNHFYDLLLQDASSQPQVCVHYDYHSRNLMLLNGNRIGILDFQDAVFGPVTYDLVSLLRDCYVRWPANRVKEWVEQFYRQAAKKGLIRNYDVQQYLRWFDWIGLLRHLRCIGLFARLHLRDHKSGYLQDIPRVVDYVKEVCSNYPEFLPLKNLFIKYGITT